MTIHHYLRPLLMPESVALVGASDRPGKIGRVVFENLLDGGFKGDIYPVNPSHRKVLGQKCYSSLGAIGKHVDLVLVAVPCAAVPGVIDDAAAVGAKAAAIMTAPPIDDGEARRWRHNLLERSRKRRIRLLGPHAFGVIRTELGLNGTLGAVTAHPGRLALIAQSGAVCTAMLDFATPIGIGFSTVISLGGAIDIGFGELLDALLLDPNTDGILLYIERIDDARQFISALRAAARTKPVVVLKAGRSMERAVAAVGETEPPPPPDAVFEAALKRAGTVRVMTYTQLFAAARLLALGRIPRGNRLAIVTNGHGPGTLAADSAFDRGVELAHFTPETEKALKAVLPPTVAPANPVNVRGDAAPERLASAVATVLADPGVDAVLALHVPRPLTAGTDAARAVAAVARGSSKPVLGAWLGSIDRREVRNALEAGGSANFYTPEMAVDAFSFVASYRRNQQWLLEVPPPQPEPEPPDLATAERIRNEAAAANRTVLTELETTRLLAAFGLPVLPAEPAETLREALAAGRKLGYPVALQLDTPGLPRGSPLPRVRANLRNGRMLTRAYGELLDGVHRVYRRGDFTVGIIVAKERPLPDSREIAIGVHTDAVFGPVITFGNSGTAALVDRERSVLLPPLNRRLALDVIGGTRVAATLKAAHEDGNDLEPLVRILLRLSTLVCELPWVRALVLDPVRAVPGAAVIGGARIVVDPKRKFATGGYRHMAIHPYPIELSVDVSLRDGTRLHVRPIMPEDAELERAFVNGLSEQTRYFRFFYRLHELTPGMLARFTQVDYDREMALVAIDGVESPSIIGVARYILNPDQESAEYAVVIADTWHGRGVARALMERLIACAKTRGIQRLEGVVLRNNANMLRFVQGLGFVVHDDPDEPEQVNTVLDLA
jgi:acetyltransferase